MAGFTHKKILLLLTLVSVIFAAIFITFPQIDLYISGLFYKSGQGFYLSETPILLFLRKSVPIVTITLTSLWFAVIAITSFRKKPVFGLSRIKAIYFVLALAIGPGLVVNTVFKDHWGRARPATIQEFGGSKIFTPAFVISNQCDVNCSFVSGDPSVGFYFFALALALPQRRKLFTGVAFGLGTAYSITRIIQGGHFFSDVIFSGIFTFSVAYLLYMGLQKFERESR